jgi:hypothetical protein
VLTPGVMRSALAECSRSKVDEIGQGNVEPKKILTRLGQKSDSMIMPFDAEELGLDTSDIEALTQWGALRRDADGRYRMPEICRLALGFRTVGRARVVW